MSVTQPLEENPISILCFGDSNTWGFIPEGGRFPSSRRWAGQLRAILSKKKGKNFEIYEEGLNGRTTQHDDPNWPIPSVRNGLRHLRVSLETHKPLRFVVIALGTNDLKGFYELSPNEIAKGVDSLVEQVQSVAETIGFGGSLHVVVLVPPPLSENISSLPHASTFTDRKKSQELKNPFLEMTKKRGCDLIILEDLNVKSSSVDGVHYDAETHDLIAQIMVGYVEQRLETPSSEQIILPQPS